MLSNTNPTVASSRSVRSEQYSGNPQYAQYAGNLSLRDEDFALASMHREEVAKLTRMEDARIDLYDERQPLPSGWLRDINSSEQGVEFNDESEARYHEPTNAERLAGAQVEAIANITPYMRGVRLSRYTAEELAGKLPADFDLTLL